MSVNLDPVDAKAPTESIFLQSSSTTVASSSSSSTSSSYSSKKGSSVHKLIAFPPNSHSSPSLSVIDSDYNKNQQNQRECLSGSSTDHNSVSSSSSSFPVNSTDIKRKSLDNNYSTLNDVSDCKLDREWCSARKRQLDEILIKLQQLHKLNLDDRESIEGMRKKTIKLIATYSSITMKTNNFLTRWERKYGSKVKAIQTFRTSSPSSPPTSSSPFSQSRFDEKFDTNYLFNSTPIW